MRIAALAVLLLAACGTQSTASRPSSPKLVSTPAVTPSPATVGSIGLAGCPETAPGQHPLDNPGGPGGGDQWQGCGSVIVPPGSRRFATGDNWGLGYAATCPNELNYGLNGMGPNVVFNEVLVDGTLGPDTAEGFGPWTYGEENMPHAGSYRLRITSPDARCRWWVEIYPS